MYEKEIKDSKIEIKNMEKEAQLYIDRVKVVENKLKRYQIIFNKLNNQFNETQTGKEHALIGKYIKEISNSDTRINESKSIYDKLIHDLNELRSVKLSKKIKTLESGLDEAYYIEAIILELQKEKNTTVAIKHFIQELVDYIRHIKSKGDNSTAKKIMKNSFIKRAIYYKRERQKIAELLMKIKNDDTNWSYFRKDFYKHIDKIKFRFAKEYGDEEFAKHLIEERDKYHEDRNQWIKFITEKLNNMDNNAHKLLETEEKAREEMIAILSKRNSEIKKNQNKTREETIKILKNRQTEIMQKKDRIVKKYKLWEREILERVDAMKEVEKGGIDIPKEGEKIRQEFLIVVKSEHQVREWIEKLKNEQFSQQWSVIKSRVLEIHEHRKAKNRFIPMIMALINKAKEIKTAQNELLKSAETKLDNPPKIYDILPENTEINQELKRAA